MISSLLRASHYLPIITTVISAIFAWVILSRFAAKPQSRHLLWWGLGVATYGAGTVTESLITLFGWNIVLFKAWYITGALLGGAPLAIGTVYLLWGNKPGNAAVTILVSVVSVTSLFVILSPIDLSLVDPHVPNSKVLGWQSIRIVSPFINGGAALFLIGGAFYSAFRYLRYSPEKNRFYGNLLIAVGAILPGIGGFMSRKGHTEALYIGELLGIMLIWSGYRLCQSKTIAPSGAESEKAAPLETPST
jgi:hypothetical protein